MRTACDPSDLPLTFPLSPFTRLHGSGAHGAHGASANVWEKFRARGLTKDRMDRTGQAGGWIADSEVWHLQRRAAGVKILHVNSTPRGRG